MDIGSLEILNSAAKSASSTSTPVEVRGGPAELSNPVENVSMKITIFEFFQIFLLFFFFNFLFSTRSQRKLRRISIGIVESFPIGDKCLGRRSWSK